jgi:CheY-like chemotaxis protein
MNAKRILSIGQCGADHYSISTFLQSHFENIEVDPVASAADAVAALQSRPYDLVLVNRRLDIDGSSGIDIIRRLKKDAAWAPLPMMLVSNHADAQKEAKAAGALPGIGKANLSGAAAAVVRAALDDMA